MITEMVWDPIRTPSPATITLPRLFLCPDTDNPVILVWRRTDARRPRLRVDQTTYTFGAGQPALESYLVWVGR